MFGAEARSRLGVLADASDRSLDQLTKADFVARLLQRDPGLWTADAEVADRIAARLGWVGPPRTAADIAPAAGTTLLVGMGGSSLGAEAAALALGLGDRLRVLDSTVPAAVRAAAARLDSVTDIVVASKSGTTLETSLLADYLEDLAPPATRFHAITDPGSALALRAEERRYVSCFLNDPAVGGRFSVLTHFGLVPLALAGGDVAGLLRRAADVEEQEGVWLGATLGAALASGRNKLLLRAEPAYVGLADWIEQLIAESTGKAGRGLVPVPDARDVDLAACVRDGVLVHLGNAASSASVSVAADMPTIRIELGDPSEIGAVFYAWEVATAAVGYLAGFNPFDEPDVAAAKRRTTEILEGSAGGGELPRAGRTWVGESISVSIAGRGDSADWTTVLSSPDPGGYMAVLAYLDRSGTAGTQIARIRDAVGGGAIPVGIGWGPRYLHSSGQLHKGGPPGATLLMVTSDDSDAVSIPSSPWDFATVAAAQAGGDRAALAAAGQTIVHVNLGADIELGINELIGALRAANGDR